MIVYGIAIHHLGDLFAHSAAIPQNDTYGVRITHENGADDPNVVPQRYQAAQEVIENMLGHLDKSASKNSGIGLMSDFCTGTDYSQYFYLRKFGRFVDEIVMSEEYDESYVDNYLHFIDPHEDKFQTGLHAIN